MEQVIAEQAIAFFVGLAGSLGIVALATGLNILYMLVIPGPKGYISAAFQRTLRIDDVQSAKEQLSRRLEQLKFVLDPTEADRISATRPGGPIRLGSYEDHDCESIKLIADIRLTKSQLGNVNVELTLKVGEWVLEDDVESLYVRELGEFLIADEFDPDNAPVVMRSSSNEGVIFTSGLLGVGLVSLLFAPCWPEGSDLQAYVLHTIGCLGFFVAFMSRGMRTVAKTYPTRIRASLLAPATVGLTVAASIILHFRWEQTHILATVLYTVASVFAWQLTKAMERVAAD